MFRKLRRDSAKAKDNKRRPIRYKVIVFGEGSLPPVPPRKISEAERQLMAAAAAEASAESEPGQS